MGPPLSRRSFFRQDNTCPALLFGHPLDTLFAYGTVTLSRRIFQTILLKTIMLDVTRLIRVRSPLLTESLLISFPLGT